MLIEDIDMDLPYKKNHENILHFMSFYNKSEQEAIRLDYERNWKQKRMKFRDEIRCIAEMYTQHVGEFKTKSTKKIMINCVETVENLEIKTTDGFSEVEVKLDIKAYFALSNIEKKKIILETIHEGTLRIATKYQWEYSLFQNAYNIIINNDYKNEYVWKQKISPTKKFVAEVYCQHEIDTFNVSLIIKDKINEEIKKELLFKETPNEFAFDRHLGNLIWISNDEAALINKRKTKKWSVSIPTK